jgi:8-oxo-dGTP pyrophosphatase MutT (NUDIX family)
MDKNEFRTRYSLHRLSDVIPSAPAKMPSRKAAVLIPLIEKNKQLHIMLTQRPMHLRSHPGQISFPGGKTEQGDKDDIATALREAHEEIGLVSSNVEVLGQFPPHKTFTGFDVTPVVGIIERPFTLVIDPGEVQDCFTVPLQYFIRQENRHQKRFMRNGKEYTVYLMPFENRFIWGVTAAIIDLLCRHISLDNVANIQTSR